MEISMNRDNVFNPLIIDGLKKTNQNGFTLIELIMVIVILGILSAFALPKFADFSGQAEKSSIEGASGGMRSASAIAHAACLASTTCDGSAGASGATSTAVLDGTSIAMVYGYPSAAGMLEAAGLDGYHTVTIGTTLIVAIDNGDAALCLTYTPATSTGTVITASTVSAVGAYLEGATPGTTDTCS